MSTKDKERSEKLAAGRKKLKKFQSRQQSGKTAEKKPGSEPLLLSLPAPETNVLLQGVGGAPELTAPLTSFSLSNSLSLTTPTDLPPPVANGYINGDEWSLTTRPLTPPRDLVSVETSQHSLASESEDSQLQAQTIDILVSEKSSLQSEINSLQTDLRHRKREVEELRTHLQTTRLQLEENERLKLSLSQEKTHLERSLLEESRGRVEAEVSLHKMKTALDDTRQENTELVSKVTSQASELHSLQQTNSDLRGRLTMAELLNQQLSSSPSSPGGVSGESLTQQLEELRGEVGRLEAVVRSVSGERDQALGDLDALREAMIQQRQDSTERLSELHLRLAESEAERLSLSEQLSDLSQRQYELAEHASSEHAQYQQSTQIAMETLQKEKEELQNQLQWQLAESERQKREVDRLEARLEETEREGERLRETAVDSRALLATMSQDKEALSRAVAQNRELKTQLEELQDGFVRLSQQNMELASDLETERFRVSQLQTQLQAQVEQEAEREKGGEGERGEEMEVDGDGEEEGKRPGVEVATQTTVEEEKESLRLQLEELGRERDELKEEVTQLNLQLVETTTQPITTANDRGSPTDNEAANQTLDILSALQANFNALQERYVAVMTEKAELLEQVEQRELTIGQLSGETETIGEYIMLYQAQREALRAKFKEKDNFIQRLISEKEAVQTQLSEVQRLMKQLVTDRTGVNQLTSHDSPSPPPPSSPSSFPLHLRPLTHDHHTAPPPPPPPPATEDTVGQIFQLLSEMGEPHGSERGRGEVVPCACCTGDVISL